MFTGVLTQVVILFILIILGAIFTKAGIFTEKCIKGITDLVLIIVTPCVVIKSFVREFKITALKNLLISFLIAFLTHIAFILISRLVIHDSEKTREKVLQFGVVFSNCGYMSIPLQQALLGEDGVFYASSYIAIFSLFVWSYGILTMSEDKKYLSPKKILISPGIIGLVVGVVVFVFAIPLPKIIYEPISYLAAMNTPLPMLIIGFHLTKSNLLLAFKSVKTMIAIILKLVVFPLLALAVMYLCGIRGVMLVSSVISCSAPVAAITTMFASKFDADVPLSVNLVSLSTALSLITMPLIITLAQYVA